MNSTCREHPRIAAINIPEFSEMRQALSSLGGTIDYYEGEDTELAVGDYSAIIEQGVGDSVPLTSPWYGLFFMGEEQRQVCAHWDDDAERLLTFVLSASYAQQFEVTNHSKAAGLDALCRRSVLKLLNPSTGVVTIAPDEDWTDFRGDEHLWIEPLVEENLGRAVAGIVRRSGEEPFGVVLPSVTTHRGEWIDAVYDRWHQSDPILFPARGSLHDRAWMTPDQEEADARLESHRRHAATVRSELEDVEQSLLSALSTVDSNHQTGMQALLFASGRDLEISVQSALEAFGLNVTDGVQIAGVKGVQREDLQVRSDIDPTWVAIVEVKGYLKSTGKTNVTRQITECATVFTMREGNPPSARWLVVNTEMNQPVVSRRQTPFLQRSDMVQDFASDGGLIIPTTVLFRYWKDIKSGVRLPQDVESLLLGSTGMFAYHSPS